MSEESGDEEIEIGSSKRRRSSKKKGSGRKKKGSSKSPSKRRKKESKAVSSSSDVDMGARRYQYIGKDSENVLSFMISISSSS